MASQSTENQTPISPEESSRNKTWNLVELSSLILAKRAEAERTRTARGSDRFETADTKWSKIEQALRRDGFIRRPDSIKKRWERLSAEFKKIYDYDRMLGSGQLSYYALDPSGRAEKRLPKAFPHTHFDLMLSWVPAARAVDPEGINIMDSSQIEAEAEVTENISSQDAQGAEANITLDDNGSTIRTQARKRKQN
jgi:hypothetical protein